MKKLFVVAMVVVMLLCGTAFASITTLEELAAEFQGMSSDGFAVTGEYFKEANCMMVAIKCTDISTVDWDLSSTSTKAEYKDLFMTIADYQHKLVGMVDLLENADTISVTTFQLMDGNAIYIAVDGVDLSTMISG